jgi:hypothetical protein
MYHVNMKDEIHRRTWLQRKDFTTEEGEVDEALKPYIERDRRLYEARNELRGQIDVTNY